MFVVVEQGGFQFKIAQGDFIEVPLVEAEAGTEITIDKVLMVSDGDKVTVGAPLVAGALAKAKVVEHAKRDKILIIKKRRREDYRRKNGHRQDYTRLEITSISA